MPFGINGLSRAYHAGPPTGLSRQRVGGSDILITGKRVADQHRIGLRFVQRAHRFIGDVGTRQDLSAIERKICIEAQVAVGNEWRHGAQPLAAPALERKARMCTRDLP
jgi:hypothetical protein